ncbi:hypothetical protein BK026_11810 [Alteromonas sp. V450]|nr:hypothetical protein BK026_11810 [Alteromonas sp. V450]
MLALLSGCASLSDLSSKGPAYKLSKNDEETFNTPLRPPKPLSEVSSQVTTGDDDEIATSMQIIQPPKVPVKQASREAESMFVPQLEDTKVERQSYNNMPVTSFINEVYGNQLGLNFVIQPTLKQVKDLITLRVADPLSQKDFYALVTRTLEDYGITTFENDGVLVFDYSVSVAEGLPLLATGETLPEIPVGNRPIFQIYPLKYVKPTQVRSTIYQMFPKSDLSIAEDVQRNAITLRGKLNLVRQAVEAIKVLDRPSLTDMHSVILRPNVNSASELSNQLEEILKTEGLNVGRANSSTPVRFLPLNASEQLIVFSASLDVLDYIVEWAEKLEVQRQTGLENGLFSYQVKSTQASHIVEILNQFGTGIALTADGQASSAALNKFAVDEQLNTILFSGSGKAWATALDLIKKLDKPAPAVMIEVILAEVSLNESDESAIEWFRRNTVGAYEIITSTEGLDVVSGGGLSLSLSRGAQTRAAVNFLYKNSRTTIRSRPRIMVKSGQSASIDVGDRVPIITSNVQSTNSSDAQVVQQVSYQETGVLLDIKPTVHATGFVDIEVSQELSEAVSTESSTINSPTIRTRSLDTVLTLRDGGSVLIGGLIRSTDAEGETGVPILGKLPGIGKLFRGDNSENNRTELMIMIIPYILNSPQEAETLSDDLQKARFKSIMEE